ncbi:RNA-binding protein RO60-like [Saccostrea echinata]|uniref:RNA-binding protein RO60-like n=1 Tax=Saccostrea echinata TaxID=191078 RepID=UPI002A8370B5|nr:RNA-binding protein RO60-like [Saccostrea echinata]
MVDRGNEGDMEVDEREFLASREGACSEDQGTSISKGQVRNVADKFVFLQGPETKFAHFLRFGHSTNAYSSGSRDLETKDAECVLELIRNGKGLRVVEMIKGFSEEHLAYKQDYIIYALAICCRSSETDASTKRAGYDVLSQVCKIPTHLFKFVDYCQKISIEQSSKSGWGRTHRKAISNWYIKHADVEDHLTLMAYHLYHLTKYRRRKGWTHRDVIRKSHLKIDKDFPRFVNNKLYPALKYLVMVAVKGKEFADSNDFTIEQQGLRGFKSSVLAKVITYIEQVKEARKKSHEDIEGLCRLISKHRFVREQIPTHFLNHKDVWIALSRHMPMTAMLRNLGKMSRLECLTEGSFGEQLVLSKIQNEELIISRKIHPMTFMVALNQYQEEKSGNGKKEWPALESVINALKVGFEISLKCIPPTNKHILLSFGATESMVDDSKKCIGMPSLSVSEAAAFLIKLTAKREESCELLVFSSNDCHPRSVEVDDSEEEIIHKLKMSDPSPTSDVSLPIKYALEKRKYDIDAFVILTDSNTSSGSVHPSKAFKSYCETVKPVRETDPQLVVCDMLSSSVTIGDPTDVNTLNISGFDYNVPRIINDFIRGDSRFGFS